MYVSELKTTTSTDEPINRHRRILMRTRTTPIIDHYEYTEAPTEGAKVTLPLLLAPTFQNYNEWSDLQKSYYTRHNLPRKLKVKNKNLIEEVVLHYSHKSTTKRPGTISSLIHEQEMWLSFLLHFVQAFKNVFL